jgi:hypothetical protein
VRRAASARVRHDGAQPDRPSGIEAAGGLASMETAVGIVLIVISALEIAFIVRTVQSNVGRG